MCAVFFSYISYVCVSVYRMSSDRILRFWVLHNDMLLILNDTMATKRLKKRRRKKNAYIIHDNHVRFFMYFDLDGRFGNDEIKFLNR